MKVIDAIPHPQDRGRRVLSAYPTTPLIEARGQAEIRPVLLPARSGWAFGIADGYARVKNGRPLAAF